MVQRRTEKDEEDETQEPIIITENELIIGKLDYIITLLKKD